MMTDAVYDMRCQMRVDDAVALWDAAAVKARTYPDMTEETVVEMIGPREDPEILDCLLLLVQPSLPGCEVLALTCTAGEALEPARPWGTSATVNGPARVPNLLRVWKNRSVTNTRTLFALPHTVIPR